MLNWIKTIYLNFSDLTEEIQIEILEIAKDKIDSDELRQEAKDMNIDYDTLLHERAERELYSLNFSFSV